MRWIDRLAKGAIEKAVAQRPAVLVTGIRQSGKTSLLRRIFPDAAYVTLDNISLAREAAESPAAFIERWKGESRVIIDEIQYAPVILRELKMAIDEGRSQKGKWILTGSQRFSLMSEVTESLAGRIAIVELGTLSARELREAAVPLSLTRLIFRGGFPELWGDETLDAASFYADYLKTYIERDVRSILRVGDLRDFQRFMRALAVRCGSLLNLSDLSRDVGIALNTVKSWLSVLEASGVIVLLSPFSENIGKRLIKAPKLYFADTGLAVSLMGIDDAELLSKHPHLGALWENLVIVELIKAGGGVPGQDLFYYRDSNGTEIDALLVKVKRLRAFEIKTATLPDERKLNFKSVVPLLREKGYAAEAIVAAPVREGTLTFRDYTMINPLMRDLVA
ncbi:MAG TPA: ATP-binding protein [bacterium]|nr:ATP-binding protein [bacterium]